MKGETDKGLNVMLGMLLLVYLFNFMDRQIVAILAEPIARELGMNDTQIGLMTGLTFSLFYTLLGFPIARFADRPHTNRIAIIAVATALWSVMTSISGLVQNVTQLLLARVGVGIGEAGCTPPAHSLISDRTPPEKRSRAMAIYQLGPTVGSLIGMVLGGFIADTLGWRMAFFIVGVPGIILALVVWLVLRDPRRDGSVLRTAQAAPPSDTILAAFRHIWASRALRLLMGQAALGSITIFGFLIWTTIFFQRSHGLSPGQTGLWFGLTNGGASALGIWLGGIVGDRHRAIAKRHLLTAPALAMILSAPLIIAGFIVSDWRLALMFLFPAIAMNWFHLPPFHSAVQGLVPPSARAVTSASVLFLQNLVGLGLGPLALGYLSDLLRPIFGEQSVRMVLFTLAASAALSGLMMWMARKYLDEELDRYVQPG